MPRFLKAARLSGHVVLGMFLLLLAEPMKRNNGRLLKATQRWWLFRITRLLDMEIGLQGQWPDMPDHGMLFVSNHVSWLDIPVIGGLTPLHFLAKSEVKNWPLLGRLAAGVGTLFIQRGSGDTGKVSMQIAERLQQGHSVLFFPEGTSSDGKKLLRFHHKLFQTCQHGDTVLCPVVIRYQVDDTEQNPVAFIGDDEFVSHLWNLLRYRRIRVVVCMLAPRILVPANLESQVAALHQEMAQKLEQLHQAAALNTSVQLPDESSRCVRIFRAASS